MQITAKELDKKIKNGFLSGSYLFFGDEPYLKEHYIKKIRETLCPDPDFEVFNHVRIEDGDIDRFIIELSAPAMFGMSRLIELRGVNFSKLGAETLAKLCDALSEVEEGVTALIDTATGELSEGTAKRPSAELSALTKAANVLKFERQTPAKLVVWLERHFYAEGVKASDDICRYVIDLCSADMYILANEVEKLAAYSKSMGIAEINKQTVDLVCSPNKVFGAFDFSNALISGDRRAAFAAFSAMKKRREPPERILATISKISGELLAVKTLSDGGVPRERIGRILGIADYPLGLRIKAAARSTAEKLAASLHAVNEVDKKLKTTASDGYLLIEQLILFGD